MAGDDDDAVTDDDVDDVDAAPLMRSTTSCVCVCVCVCLCWDFVICIIYSSDVGEKI